jgi:anti-sigma-K factor RskA
MLSLIASAGDLRRFDLTGRDGQTAQVLWSRTQGVAVNARDMATPPPGQAYQVWLITPGQAVSAGVLPVEPTGRASAVFDPPDALPRPVVRATITLEPTGGSPAPTGEALLAFAAPAAP